MINMASMLSFFGGPRAGLQRVSKGGVAQLTKASPRAWAGDGIRVNAVAPGWIATALTAGRSEDDAAASRRDPRAHADGALGHAGGRRGAVVFLALARRPLRHRRHPAGRRRLSRHLTQRPHESHDATSTAAIAEREVRCPTAHPQPKESPPELVIPDAIPDGRADLGAASENVWFRPLCLSASRGYWMNLLRVRKAGVLSRHRHPQPVHGFVLKGEWRYLEHDWVGDRGRLRLRGAGRDPHARGRPARRRR